MLTSLSYPLRVDKGKLITTSSYPEIVRGAILSTLYTYKDERVFNPEYGIDNYLFTTDIEGVRLDIETSLAVSLQEYPGVTVSTNVSPSDEGVLAVDVYYWVNEEEYQLKQELRV